MGRFAVAVGLVLIIAGLAYRAGIKRDQVDHLQSEIKTLERIEDAPDLDLDDDAARTLELCRLAYIANCPL